MTLILTTNLMNMGMTMRKKTKVKVVVCKNVSKHLQSCPLQHCIFSAFSSLKLYKSHCTGFLSSLFEIKIPAGCFTKCSLQLSSFLQVLGYHFNIFSWYIFKVPLDYFCSNCNIWWYLKDFMYQLLFFCTLQGLFPCFLLCTVLFGFWGVKTASFFLSSYRWFPFFFNSSSGRRHLPDIFN